MLVCACSVRGKCKMWLCCIQMGLSAWWKCGEEEEREQEGACCWQGMDVLPSDTVTASCENQQLVSNGVTDCETKQRDEQGSTVSKHPHNPPHAHMQGRGRGQGEGPGGVARGSGQGAGRVGSG